jgi:hypothetical protein
MGRKKFWGVRNSGAYEIQNGQIHQFPKTLDFEGAFESKCSFQLKYAELTKMSMVGFVGSWISIFI